MPRSKRRRAVEPALEDLADVTTALIYRAISRSGRHELARPFSALWWSGVGAGLAISLSILCKGILTALLPDTAWRRGHQPGLFGRLSGGDHGPDAAVHREHGDADPAAARYPSISRLGRTARLWAIVFAANMTGCLIAAILMVHAGIIPPLQMSGVVSVSRHYAEVAPLDHLLWGMPAGFMIAALVWMLPRIESAGEVLMIMLVTYMIGLGGFSHVVAGSTELFIVMLLGEIDPFRAVFGGILPALVGNVIGGTVIFAALAYAQVREEI